MAWFGVGSGSRRANRNARSGFKRADRVVVEAFANLQKAHHIKSKQFTGISPAAVQRFERKAWDRLIDYLIKLPPLPSDDCHDSRIGTKQQQPRLPREEGSRKSRGTIAMTNSPSTREPLSSLCLTPCE
jgi:hypothetical protein